jgi:hypothetical protein
MIQASRCPKKARPGGRWLKQVAGHVGAESGRHVVNGHARPEFQPSLKHSTERAAEAARSYELENQCPMWWGLG